jgi:hypothetical protein
MLELCTQFQDYLQSSQIVVTICKLRAKSWNCAHNFQIVIATVQLRSTIWDFDHNLEIAAKNQKFFLTVSGFARFRSYTYEEQLLSNSLKIVEPGGAAEEFLGKSSTAYREMMLRAARSITRNDYDADDVIQKLCVRFVTGGIPDGLRENRPAYLIGCIVNEAKTVHRTRQRQRIDGDVDLQ